MKEKIASNWGPWLISFVLLSLAFPPANVYLLIFVALVPWLKQLREGNSKLGFWSGYGFGFCYFGFQMFWVVGFVGKWTGSYGLAVVPWLVCAFLAGWFYAGTGWLMARCFKLNLAFLVPLIWAGSEAFRAYVPSLAFPWGIVALPLWKVPALAQGGAFGTIFLVSAWVVLVNMILLEVVYPKEGAADRKIIGRAGVVALGFAVLSVFRYSTAPAGVDKTFTLGQPGVNMAFSTPEQEHEGLLNATGELLQGAINQRADLLILPEGYAGKVSGDPVNTPLGFEPQLHVIMGGQRLAGGTKVYQTAYAWDGSEWSFADKTRLVVFGEYVPFRDQLPFLRNFNLPAGDLIEGKELKTLSVGGLEVGPLICFEGVFPDLAIGHGNNGAQVLVQMSIDDWYEGTPAHDQLWMSSIWRSIESGLPLMRVGARGHSLATDSRGNLIANVPVGVRRAEKVTVKVPGRSDAFSGRFGFVYICWAVCLGVFGWSFLSGKTSKSQVDKTGALQ
ncbi:MAG: apolipoprotein N-acyltransferase [Fimbriimonadaceae bacterium]